MRKYLFIMANEGYRWGGSEPLWSQAAERLARNGNEVRVSVKDWGNPVPQVERLRDAGCQIFYRDLSPRRFVTRQLRKILQKPELRMEHIQSLSRGVDLTVISQGANWDGLEWIEGVRSGGSKYAIISQGAADLWWPRDEDADRVATCYDGASGAYFVSEANVELSRLQFGSPLRNAKVVRNPFNVPYDARPAWPDGLPDRLSLACVGRLDPAQKGQDILFQVLCLPHWRERNVRVTLVGNGMNEGLLRRAADELQLKNVTFAGQVEDIEAVWSKHHALAIASRYEGLPLSLVEAMLCGRPAIMTDVAGHRELIRHGINGFLAKAPTVELFDEALNRAWDCRAQLRRMGEQAAIDVRQFVGPDPAGDFARELEALAQG